LPITQDNEILNFRMPGAMAKSYPNSMQLGVVKNIPQHALL